MMPTHHVLPPADAMTDARGDVCLAPRLGSQRVIDASLLSSSRASRSRPSVAPGARPLEKTYRIDAAPAIESP